MIIAGIGARNAPRKVLAGVRTAAEDMCASGLHLRTGGAHGCDETFEKAYTQLREEFAANDYGTVTVFVPWYGFNRRTRGVVNCQTLPKFGQAMELAEQLHPAWDRCSRGAKALHARNCFVLLGPNLDAPVDAVVCWTPGGRRIGGTGQSLRLARHFGIPIFNFHDSNSLRLSNHELSPYFQSYMNETLQWDDMYAGRC